MWQDVLKTYKCLIQAKKFRPGLSIEDLFDIPVEVLEKEYEYLKLLAKESGFYEDETGLRGQYEGHRE